MNRIKKLFCEDKDNKKNRKKHINQRKDKIQMTGQHFVLVLAHKMPTAKRIVKWIAERALLQVQGVQRVLHVCETLWCGVWGAKLPKVTLHNNYYTNKNLIVKMKFFKKTHDSSVEQSASSPVADLPMFHKTMSTVNMISMLTRTRFPEIRIQSRLRNLAAKIAMPNLEWAQKMDYLFVINYIFSAAEKFGVDLGLKRESALETMRENLGIAKISDWDNLADGLIQKLSAKAPYQDLLQLRARIDGNHTTPQLINRMIGTMRIVHDLDVPRVFNAMAKFPRHWFVPPDRRFILAGNNLFSPCYEDNPFPIGDDQTISQPYMVANMLNLLDLKGHEKVLDVGCGSGYQAAVLSELCREAYSIDILENFVLQANELFEFLGISKKVKAYMADGWQGLPEHGPYDRIIVAAGADATPQLLCRQLSIGGKLLIPIFTGHYDLDGGKIFVLCKVERKGPDEFVSSCIPDSVCRFVPLVKMPSTTQSGPQNEEKTEQQTILNVEFNLPAANEISPQIVRAQRFELLDFISALTDFIKIRGFSYDEKIEINNATTLDELSEIIAKMINILEANCCPFTVLKQLKLAGMITLNLPNLIEGLIEKIKTNLSLMEQNTEHEKIFMSIRSIPRQWFIPSKLHYASERSSFLSRDIKDVKVLTYDDKPIKWGQFEMSCQPSVAALSISNLEIEGEEDILEMGFDTGYQTAIMADLLQSTNKGGRVYTIKPSPEYQKVINERLGYNNVVFSFADPKTKPFGDKLFDRIILSSPPDEPGIPDYLFDQLKEGGVMVLPAFPPKKERENPSLIKVKKINGKMEIEIILQQLPWTIQ